MGHLDLGGKVGVSTGQEQAHSLPGFSAFALPSALETNGAEPAPEGDQTEEIPPFPLLDANPPERRVAGVFADFPALPEYHGAQAAVVLRRLRQGDAPGGSAHTRTGVRSARSVRTPPG